MLFEIPKTGYLRIHQILGNPKAEPPVQPIIPVGKTTWWAGVRSGRFPRPIKPFGAKITVWRAEDINALLDGTWIPETLEEESKK